VAGAESQPFSGTVASTLGLSVSGAVALSNFAPGQTATGSGTVTVISTGPWVLRLQDTATGSPGHLVRTAGSSGESALTHALDWSSTATAGGSGGSGTLSGSQAVAASGTLSSVVTMAYSQAIDADELVATGSVYSVTVTLTVSPT
jgi:hypothetical protein